MCIRDSAIGVQQTQTECEVAMNTILGQRIREQRKEKGWTIEQYEREGRAEHDQLDKIQDFIGEVSKYAGITELNYKICLLYTSLGTIIWTPTERKPSSLMALPLPLTALPSRTNTAIPRHSELNLIGYYLSLIHISRWCRSWVCGT